METEKDVAPVIEQADAPVAAPEQADNQTPEQMRAAEEIKALVTTCEQGVKSVMERLLEEEMKKNKTPEAMPAMAA